MIIPLCKKVEKKGQKPVLKKSKWLKIGSMDQISFLKKYVTPKLNPLGFDNDGVLRHYSSHSHITIYENLDPRCNPRVFIGLPIMGYEPLYHVYKYGKRTRDLFLGIFSFSLVQFSLVLYIEGAFLIRVLFHSRLLDMRRA